MFCRGCGYDLRTLGAGKCPECGRAFDPANGRTFFVKKPRLGLRRWMKRVGIVAGVLAVIVAGLGTWFMVWRGRMVAEWEREQAAARIIQKHGGGCDDYILIVPEAISRRLKNPPYLHRISRVWVNGDAGRRLGVNTPDSNAISEQIDAVGQMHHLRKVMLASVQFDPASLRLQKANLTSISLSSAKTERDPLIGLHLGEARVLARLNAASCSVSDEGLKEISRCERLERLSIGSTKVTNSGLAHLGHLQALRELDLSGIRTIDDRGIEHLKGLARLERLNLRATNVTNAGLSALVELSSLRELDLRQTLIDDSAIETLTRMPASITVHVDERRPRIWGEKGLSLRAIESLKRRRADIRIDTGFKRF